VVAASVAQPGDRICVNCGEPNDAARKFCRRCGNALVNAQVVVAEKPVPWWRRIFKRNQKQYSAGERTKDMTAPAGPSKMGQIRRFVMLVVVVGILGSAVGYALIAPFQQQVNSVISGAVSQVTRIVNPKLVPIRPVTVTTSDQLAGHPVSQMFDKYANTDWRANGQTPSVTVNFGQKFDLGALIVHSGASDKFTETRRPVKLLLTFADGTSVTLDLKDDNAPQTINVDKNGIDGFVMTVTATSGPANQPVVVSEIEVFAKG
jgi:hypothetical protein